MIKNLEQKNTNDLIIKLRQTVLLGDEKEFPYKHANISIKTFFKDMLSKNR